MEPMKAGRPIGVAPSFLFYARSHRSPRSASRWSIAIDSKALCFRFVIANWQSN